MTDVVTLVERKGTTKCEPRVMFSATSKKMPLSGKELREIVKIYYLNGQNVAQTLRVYSRNHGLRRGPCIVKAEHDLIQKFEETGSTFDRPQFGRPSVPVETVTEVHKTISTVRSVSARGVSHFLNLPILTVSRVLRSVPNKFLFRFQRVQILEMGETARFC